MVAGFSIGYVNFTIILLLITGGLMLRFDVMGYELKNLKKEKKTARILGWINVVLGAAIFIGNWIFQKFFW
jgi:uncharacterized membrane protein